MNSDLEVGDVWVWLLENYREKPYLVLEHRRAKRSNLDDTILCLDLSDGTFREFFQREGVHLFFYTMIAKHARERR